jgi:hypothetical protein
VAALQLRQHPVEAGASPLIILDTLFIGGLRFVLDKVAAAVDAELNDEGALRDQLLAAQIRVELGEMSDEEFAVLESDVLTRLREIRERHEGEPGSLSSADYKIAEVHASFEGDEHS